MTEQSTVQDTQVQDAVQNSTPPWKAATSYEELEDAALNSVTAQQAAEAQARQSVVRLQPKGLLGFVSGLKNRSVAFYVISLASFGGVLAVGYVYNQSQTKVPPVQTIAPPQFDESYFLDNNPLRLTNVKKGQVQSSEYKQALAAATIQYDAKVLEAMNKHIDAMLSTEAVRLAAEAQKEVETGVIANNDAAQLMFDMASCPAQTINPKVCVLMRYASEGLSEMSIGNERGDLNMVTKGYFRYRAGMLAASGNEETKQFNLAPSIQGGIATLSAMRQLNTQAVGDPIRVAVPVPGVDATVNPNAGANLVNTTTIAP